MLLQLTPRQRDPDQAQGGIGAMTEVYDHTLTTNGNPTYGFGHPSMRSNTLDGTFDMTSMQPGRIAGDDAYQTTQDIFPAQDFSALQEFCQHPDDMTFGPGFLDAQPVPIPTVNDYFWLEYDQNLETGPDPHLGASSLGLNQLDVQQKDSEDCTDHLSAMTPSARFDFEAPYKEAQASVHDSGIFCRAPLNPSNAECMSGKRKKWYFQPVVALQMLRSPDLDHVLGRLDTLNFSKIKFVPCILGSKTTHLILFLK